jgi:hypothetical protein
VKQGKILNLEKFPAVCSMLGFPYQTKQLPLSKTMVEIDTQMWCVRQKELLKTQAK